MPQNNTYSPEASVDVVLNRDQHKHERSQQKEQHSYDLAKQDRDNDHSQKQQIIRLGLIGRIFGSGDNASKNITATICIILIIGGSLVSLYAYAFKDDKELVGSIWNVILPIITLSLGYVFGKK